MAFAGVVFLLGLIGVECPFLVIDEDVETGHPEIPGRFVFCSKLVYPFFGDEFKL